MYKAKISSLSFLRKIVIPAKAATAELMNVIPAKAGIQCSVTAELMNVIPAKAGIQFLFRKIADQCFCGLGKI